MTSRYRKALDKGVSNAIFLGRQYWLERVRDGKAVPQLDLLDLVNAGAVTLRTEFRDAKGRLLNRAKWTQIATITPHGLEMLAR